MIWMDQLRSCRILEVLRQANLIWSVTRIGQFVPWIVYEFYSNLSVDVNSVNSLGSMKYMLAIIILNFFRPSLTRFSEVRMLWEHIGQGAWVIAWWISHGARWNWHTLAGKINHSCIYSVMMDQQSIRAESECLSANSWFFGLSKKILETDKFFCSSEKAFHTS